MTKKEEMIAGFEEGLILLTKSNAYTNYCKDIYGYPIKLMNMLTNEDIEDIISYIEKNKPNRIIELGCGTGELLGLLASKTKHTYFGLENSPKVVEHLNSLNTNKNLLFFCEDIETYSNPKEKYDLVLIIDSLYFVEDLDKSIDNILSLIETGGKAILYYSEYEFSTKKNNWESAKTNRLGIILEAKKLNYQFTEITDRELRCWENVVNFAEKHKEAFEKEGNIQILEGNIEEAKLVSGNIRASGGKRFNYIVSK